MGSGKSTIGRRVAEKLGWTYIDNDALLAKVTGLSAKGLLEGRGEDGLRVAETVALKDGLATAPPSVVSAAAGTILDATVRGELERCAVVVWLTASPRTLARRARGSANRPWLDGDAETWMTSTLVERAPLYQSIADLVVSTERRRPEAVALQIADWLVERCR